MRNLLLIPLLTVMCLAISRLTEQMAFLKTETVVLQQLDRSMYMNATKLNVREETSSSSKAPSIVEVIGGEGEWSLVRLAEGTGYVMTSYLVSSLDEITVNGINLAYAKEHPGLA